jgi:putative nucleotidyltransferase with HDIG domain
MMFAGNLTLDQKQRIERLIKAIDRLPALPRVVNKAIKLLDDPQSTAKKVADVISYDPILTARLLRIANSAFYGFPRKIKTVRDAIIVLGFDTIKSLAVAASVHRMFNAEMAGYGIERGELWRHSVGCALCAQALAAETGQDFDEAFVAGLLHDVGKVAIQHLIGEDFKEIIQLVIEDNLSFLQAENVVLGFDHAEIGARVAAKWNLPISLVNAIKYHHNPHESKKSRKLASIIKVSDSICLLFGIGIGGEDLSSNTKKRVSSILKINENRLEQLINQIGENVSNTNLDI